MNSDEDINTKSTSFAILHNASTCAAEYSKRFIRLDPGPLSTPGSFWAVASSKSTIASLFRLSAISRMFERSKKNLLILVSVKINDH